MSEKTKVCFTPEGFERLLSVLNDRFGSAGDSIIYSMAKDFGVYDSKQMLYSLKYKEGLVDEQTIVQKLLDSISSHNWGKFVIEKFDLINGEIIFNISEHPVLELCVIKDSPQCFFTKGVIAGIIKEVTGIDFNPSAMTCKGNSNVCQIVFNKR